MAWLRRRRAERALREAEEAKALGLDTVNVVEGRPKVEDDRHRPPALKIKPEPLAAACFDSPISVKHPGDLIRTLSGGSSTEAPEDETSSDDGPCNPCSTPFVFPPSD
jgi:hypothetical protein